MSSLRYGLTLVLVGFLLVLAMSMRINNYSGAGDDYYDNYREWMEFKEFKQFQAWKEAKEQKLAYISWNNYLNNLIGKKSEENNHRQDREPPPIDQYALMARYIVNQAGWTSIATISSRKDIASYPFVNVISFSDGPPGNGTGMPYLYLTPLDFTAQDLFQDNRATLLMTLAQGRYCQEKDYDPMDPRCARVVLSGKIKEVKESNPEYPLAKSAVFGRHPWLAHMPKDHRFFFATLKISSIALLDTFGGPKYISINEYLHPPSSTNKVFIDSFLYQYRIGFE